ncbi:zinc finger BED domain-containing protein 1-like, partial [Aphis craccivora]
LSIPKKNSSIAWKHFQRAPNTSVITTCTICKNQCKRSNGTTNLLDHLK